MNTLPEDGLKQTFSPKKDSYLSDPWMYDSQLTLFMFFFKDMLQPWDQTNLKEQDLRKRNPSARFRLNESIRIIFFSFHFKPVSDS